MHNKDRDKLYDFCEQKAQGAGDRDKWDATPYVKGLCGSCNYSHIYKQKSKNHLIILCDRLGGDFSGPLRVYDDITQCSRYSNKNEVSLHAMVETATLIDISEDTQEIGFRRSETSKDPTLTHETD